MHPTEKKIDTETAVLESARRKFDACLSVVFEGHVFKATPQVVINTPNYIDKLGYAFDHEGFPVRIADTGKLYWTLEETLKKASKVYLQEQEAAMMAFQKMLDVKPLDDEDTE